MNEQREQQFKLVSKSITFRNILDTFDLRHKTVLDIGCSYGEFLIHFGNGSTGVTISEEEVAYGKEKGLDIRKGNIEENDLVLEKTYDVIFANNIFEHLYSPHAFLIKIKDSLKPDGILILGVPSVPKIVLLLKLKKFRGSLAMQHINFFTRMTLRKTVERGGWKVEDVRGFHFKNKFVDYLFNLVYPHFYVVAKMDPDFQYPEKRMKELRGYKAFIDSARKE